MRVRVRKEPSADGWNKYIIESKVWYLPFWEYRGCRMSDPWTEGKDEYELKKAIRFAEDLLSNLTIEVKQ